MSAHPSGRGCFALVFAIFPSVTPPEVVMLVQFDIWFEIPSFTHPLEVVMLSDLIYGLKFLPLLTPLRGSNVIRFVIWFEIPSITHPLEVVMLFGLIYGLKFLPLLTP
jgi:hypothetical protein